MDKAADFGELRRQTPMDKGDSAIAARNTDLHPYGAAVPMSAGVAYRGLTFFTPTLRLPKGTRYVVRRPDDDCLIVYLVSNRKWKQWPRWKRISSLIPCKRIVEDGPPDTRVPQRRLYF